MKSPQLTRLCKLLTRSKGCTSMEIITECQTTAPHRRLMDLKQRGWAIYSKPVEGRNFLRYFGMPPADGGT